ncbi:MAG TPA: site-specific integrase [Candidatus Acidoferrum sp.]|nr:site-specific integrase [Candidatus Acidoferrum sp.]
MKTQSGTIKRIGGSWYGRWREDVIENGRTVRKQRFLKLCEVDDRYRTKADVRPLLAEKLRALNEGRTDARSSLTLVAFVGEYYEPYTRGSLKPSTVHGYSKLWEALSPRVGEVRLRDFRTVDAANMLAHFAQRGWGRRSLQHAKSLLSGIFTYAKNLGVLDGVNPVQGTIIPRKAVAPSETHASTPDEVITILDVLKRAKSLPERQKLQAQTAIALMFFGGLRPGEARGATWENYDGKTLSIKQSVWRKHTTDPKTASAAKPVPVIEPLREFLAELRAEEGKPGSGPILRGVKGKPLSLDMLARIVIRPALRNRANYRNGQSKHWKPLEWQGYYALRRGIATQLNTITRDPMAAKGLLRHSSVNTTLTHYIKSVPEVTANGMAQVEQLFSAAAGQAVQ